MKKVLEKKELQEIKGGVTAYYDCPTCGTTWSGWSLFGVIAFFTAKGRANECMYSHLS